MPKVSVIVPVYNVERYLDRCMESILHQTFQDYEVILVDDGTKDSSGAICDAYAAEYAFVRVLHKENGGLSSARNAGIRMAAGEYLLFADSDDVLHKQCIEVLYQELLAYKADIAMGFHRRFKDGIPVTAKEELGEHACTSYRGIEMLELFFDQNIRTAQLVSVCGKLFKKELFEILRFPEGRLFEDEFISYRLYDKAQKIVWTEAEVYYYFLNEAGITQNLTPEKRLDEYDAQWERLLFLQERGLYELYQKALLYFLKTARWDLIECRKRIKEGEYGKKKSFLWQYTEVFKRAKQEKLLCFERDYDYYVLGKPQWVFYYRIKRLCLKIAKKGCGRLSKGGTMQEWTTVIRPKNGLFDLRLKELWAYRDLILMFVRRDFKTMYKQTILGPMWVLLTPVLTTLMQVLVFGNIADISTDGTPPFLFYMAGNTMWLYFSGCLTKTASTFTANAAVFGKVYFPRLVTPISIVLSQLISFGVQFGIFGTAVLYYTMQGSICPNVGICLFPLLVAELALLGMGCGIIISALTAKYRDLAVLVTFGVQLWMYASAIIFPVSGLAEKWQALLLLNPVVPVVEAFRYIFTGRGVLSFSCLGVSAVLTLVILAVGVLLFNKVEKNFMDTV